MALYLKESYTRDADLVLEFQNGNHDAFSELVSTHLPWVYGICRRVSPSEAEDLCQEVFIQVYRNLPGLKHPQTFVAWLRKLAWHYCQRHSTKIRHLDIAEAPSIPVNPWDIVHDGFEFGWAIDQLNLDQRQVIILSLLYGYKEKEIADILAIPAGTVKSRLYKARKILQNLLTKTEGAIALDIKERIISEIDKRINEFNNKIIHPIEEDPSIADREV